MIAVIAVTGVDATHRTEREHLSNNEMKNLNRDQNGSGRTRPLTARASSARKAKRSKSMPMVIRDPDDTEKRAIVAAKQAIAEMPPRFDIGTQIKTENGVTQIIEGPRHSDMDGWRAQLMAAFGTTSENVAHVEVERIAKALRQRDGKIDPRHRDCNR